MLLREVAPVEDENFTVSSTEYSQAKQHEGQVFRPFESETRVRIPAGALNLIKGTIIKTFLIVKDSIIPLCVSCKDVKTHSY